MEDEYSLQNIADILGITRRAVQKRAQKESWNCEKRPNPKGGGSQKLCRRDRLPRDVREAIGRHVLEETLARRGVDVPIPASVARAIAEQNAPCADGNGASAGEIDRPVNGNGSTVKPKAESVREKPYCVRLAGKSVSAIATPVKGDGRSGPEFTNGSPAVTAPQAISPALCKPAAIIPERAAADGLAKYRLVSEWRKVMAAQPWGKKDEATRAFLLAYNSGRLLPAVYETIGELTDKTIYRLDRKLREAGDDYRAISDGRGGWRLHGTTRWRPRELAREAQEEFLRCYLRPERPTVTLAIRAARMLLQKRSIAEDASDATWRRWLHDFEKRHQHVIILAREGEKAYRDKVGPYISRDDSLLKVGQVLVADGHKLNFHILHPISGKPVRMILICFFDWASRYPVGWQIMPTESTTAISAALRSAILTLGKYPSAVYLDNGKSFKSRFFTETTPDFEELTGIYGRLGIATCFAQPYNARAKVVERFFGTLSIQCEPIIPSYCGSSIAQKPAHMLRNEKLHRAWHQARTQGWVPDIREASYLLDIYFRWYGSQPHEGLGGRLPLDVLKEGLGPGVDPESLTREFLWTKKCTVRRCRVRVHGIDYESDCLHGIAGNVIVRYDTSDMRRVYCYLPEANGGGYLGEAEPVEALHPLARLFGDELNVDQVEGAIKRQRKLLKQTKEGLIGLGVAPTDAEGGLRALPWNQRAAVIPGGKSEAESSRASSSEESHAPSSAPGAASPAEDEAERARLQLVYSRLETEAAKAAEPPGWAIPKPENFALPWVRYDWCFRIRYEHGQELDEVDAAFMAWFELEPDFEIHRQRYQDLCELFALQKGESMQ